MSTEKYAAAFGTIVLGSVALVIVCVVIRLCMWILGVHV